MNISYWRLHQGWLGAVVRSRRKRRIRLAPDAGQVVRVCA
ncbi:hypothetical protein PACID_16900 [Acidipropionibacterium acidipropionici ATCC 4875]|uniref:Uncharacterized protein n=1 Tax=Acidipropionibacterium acidipropionici (strain ATCC 4875 / DSM 20272 / JCM 6432 / NBRC 12425 / NCIMB 8070 / 4) TaxID=1171373 RepID=K7RX11_ACIA4|nr:hypothetical protein PACID_16900 [Acidipropionibacterium acidipropionici ATCC 4875]